MAITHEQIPEYINYFLYLEEDIQKLSRWIDFSEDNEGVYSIELARLLMVASAEVDVIAKALCHKIDPNRDAKSINIYQSVLTTAIPFIHEAEVQMPKYGMTFKPFSNWSTVNTPPTWWTANNKIKHHRNLHFKKATLKNVLNSAAGLITLLILYYSSERPYFPMPNLFMPRFFATPEGAGLGTALRLWVPDGTTLPWA
jgi:hypothetical protein